MQLDVGKRNLAFEIHPPPSHTGTAALHKVNK